jgi:NAD-dependent deacetylase
MTASIDSLALTREWATLWRASSKVVIFSGAGMSTESGLPDFRSAGGLWKQNQRFEDLASVSGLERSPAEFREFYRWRIENLAQHAPHRGHEILAELQAQGRVQRIITQNVDGFHDAAGSKHVLALHGTLRSTRCQRCGTHAPMAEYLAPNGGSCAHCGGAMRPNVVLFGEGLDSDVLDAAANAARDCDLFIVFGSSLLVSPANALPRLALDAGAKLVIVNQEPTPLDARAAVIVRGQIGPALEAVQLQFATH